MQHICTGVPDLVTGKPAMRACKDERFGGWQCGPGGTMFKPRVDIELALPVTVVKDPNSASGERLEVVVTVPSRDMKRGRSDG